MFQMRELTLAICCDRCTRAPFFMAQPRDCTLKHFLGGLHYRVVLLHLFNYLLYVQRNSIFGSPRSHVVRYLHDDNLAPPPLDTASGYTLSFDLVEGEWFRSLNSLYTWNDGRWKARHMFLVAPTKRSLVTQVAVGMWNETINDDGGSLKVQNKLL
jgi:hypothetical protein